MGEKKGGGSEGHEVGLDKLAKALVDEYESDGRGVGKIVIQRLTEGVYAVEVTAHGEQEPERFFLGTE